MLNDPAALGDGIAENNAPSNTALAADISKIRRIGCLIYSPGMSEILVTGAHRGFGNSRRQGGGLGAHSANEGRIRD